MSGIAKLQSPLKNLKKRVAMRSQKAQRAVTQSRVRRKKMQPKATEKGRKKARVTAVEKARPKERARKKRMMLLTTKRIAAWNCTSSLSGRQQTEHSTSGASLRSCRPSLTTRCTSNCALSSS